MTGTTEKRKNLSVAAVRRVRTDAPVPVYDLTVAGTHSFQLASGPVVHNSHIQCLLLGFFFQHMRPLVERGHVYIGLPPLYRVTERGKHTYLKDDAALAEFFRSRARALPGVDGDLEALASQAGRLVDAVETAAGRVGCDPEDLAHAAGALAGMEEGATPEALGGEILRLREEAGCEATDGYVTEDGGVVVTGLAPGGRFFTTVVSEQLVEMAGYCLGLLADVVGDAAALRIAASPALGDQRFESFVSLARAIVRESQRGVTIQRNKGLGEMQAEELGETTLDPATRRLIRVRVEDFDATGEFLGSMLHDGSVGARRELVRSAEIDAERVDA